MSPRLIGTLDRRTYLGATDIAALAGVSPWKTPFDLYLEKIGELDPEARQSDDERGRKERGHRLEDVALDWYADLEGVRVDRVRRDIRHPRIPFIVVHPDARVRPWRETRKLVEAKTSGRRWDEVPRHVEAQVQAQMAATGADVVDVVVLGFDGPPTTHPVERNAQLIEALEDLARRFWERVERRDPPPMDGGRDASRWLDRMFREGPEVRADDDQARVLARLIELRAEAKRIEAEDRELVNVLKFSLAGASRLYAPRVGRVVWTAPAERRTVAWKDIAATYRRLLEAQVGHVELEPGLWEIARRLAPDDLDGIEAQHTTVAEGIRQFRITPAKEEGPL